MKRPGNQHSRRARQFAITTFLAAVCLTGAPLCLLLAFHLPDAEPASDNLQRVLSSNASGPFHQDEATRPIRDVAESISETTAKEKLDSRLFLEPAPTPRIRIAATEARTDSPIPFVSSQTNPVDSPREHIAAEEVPESMRQPTVPLPVIRMPPSIAASITHADDQKEVEFESSIEELEQGLAPKVVPSTFGATGHLAVAGIDKVSAVEEAKPAQEAEHDQRPVKDDRKRPSRSGRRQGREAQDAATAEDESKSRRAVLPEVVPALPDEPPVVVEVIVENVVLQTPVEGRPVHRVEDVIGVTRAVGWPVILIRSDLPDDLWWVQQMVSAGGNAFSGRVNFGNEQSVSGSVYHLVVVFLDSAEEMRRFRIAKQFKDLPAGIRHSRTFSYVRR